MTDITHIFRLSRGQTIELNEVEVLELRDALNRLYPPPPVLAPLVVPQAPSPIWPPVPRTGDPMWVRPIITCGSAQ